MNAEVTLQAIEEIVNRYIVPATQDKLDDLWRQEVEGVVRRVIKEMVLDGLIPWMLDNAALSVVQPITEERET